MALTSRAAEEAGARIAGTHELQPNYAQAQTRLAGSTGSLSTSLPLNSSRPPPVGTFPPPPSPQPRQQPFNMGDLRSQPSSRLSDSMDPLLGGSLSVPPPEEHRRDIPHPVDGEQAERVAAMQPGGQPPQTVPYTPAEITVARPLQQQASPRHVPVAAARPHTHEAPAAVPAASPQSGVFRRLLSFGRRNTGATGRMSGSSSGGKSGRMSATGSILSRLRGSGTRGGRATTAPMGFKGGKSKDKSKKKLPPRARKAITRHNPAAPRATPVLAAAAPAQQESAPLQKKASISRMWEQLERGVPQQQPSNASSQAPRPAQLQRTSVASGSTRSALTDLRKSALVDRGISQQKSTLPNMPKHLNVRICEEEVSEPKFNFKQSRMKVCPRLADPVPLLPRHRASCPTKPLFGRPAQ